MANLSKKITNILLKNGDDNIDYSLSTVFNNIYLNSTNSYTLTNFFNAVKTFFNKQMHMIYQGAEPTNKKVMEWYAVGGDILTDDAPIAAAND